MTPAWNGLKVAFLLSQPYSVLEVQACASKSNFAFNLITVFLSIFLVIVCKSHLLKKNSRFIFHKNIWFNLLYHFYLKIFKLFPFYVLHKGTTLNTLSHRNGLQESMFYFLKCTIQIFPISK